MFLVRANSLEKDAIEVLKGRLYFWVARSPDAVRAAASAGLVLQVDSELTYEPFASDFGPLHLGCTYRFCSKLNSLLKVASKQNQPVIFVTGNHAHKKANSSVLLGAWLVIYGGFTAEAAYDVVGAAEPFLAFRDASCGPSQLNLTVKDCLLGIERAKEVGILDWHMPASTFDLQKYEHYEQVLNGDFNWILPGKFLAFSGPTCSSREHSAYGTLGALDYGPLFKQEGITTVVRLNKPQYDRRLFTQAGFRHHDLYFPDGTCPPEDILTAFLSIAESESGAIAVHCKAGLGRTGTLIGCYMMKHYGFTAPEVIAYIRLCRPGSILGPQQRYLIYQEVHMHALGGVKPRSSERRVTVSMRSLGGATRSTRLTSAADRTADAAAARTAPRPSSNSAPSAAALLPAHPAATALVEISPACERPTSQAALAPRQPSLASCGGRSSSTTRSAASRGPSMIIGRSKRDSSINVSTQRETGAQVADQIAPAFSRFGIGARTNRVSAEASPHVVRTLAPNGQPRKVLHPSPAERVSSSVAAAAAARAESRRTSSRRASSQGKQITPAPSNSTGVKAIGMFRNA